MHNCDWPNDRTVWPSLTVARIPTTLFGFTLQPMLALSETSIRSA